MSVNHALAQVWTRSAASRRVLVSRAMVAAGLLSTAAPVVTFCEKKKGEITSKDANGNVDWGATLARVTTQDFWDNVAIVAGTQVQGAIDSGVPMSISYGFISGYCSGLALKKVGRVAAGVLGVGFVIMQTLAYYGYITVDHGKIKEQVESYMDLNNDGKLDAADAAIAKEKLLKILQYNMPSGGGFAAGFVGGLRSG